MFNKVNVKKFISLLLCVLIVFSLVACNDSDNKVTEEKTSNKKISGVYDGKSHGHNGDILVEVELDEGQIKSIDLIEHEESPVVSDIAIKDIPESIVKNQSINVDSISGATVTSKAIISAVTDALEKSNINLDNFKKEIKEENKEKENKEIDTDVIVVGGGGAGLAAAVSAHQNGAKVILLEKMPQLGGNTVLSGGAFNAVDPERQEKQNIEDSIEKHFEQTYEGGDKKGNKELIKTLVEEAYPSIQWLEDLGMKFEDEVFTVLGGLWPRAHKPSDPLGTGFVYTYRDYIENNDNIEILYNTEATELISENDSIIGVLAEGPDAKYTINSNNGVVIATGGFSQNVELRDKHNKLWPKLTDLKSTNHPGATGDGLILAEKVGANLINLEDIQLLPMGDPQTGSLSGNIEQGVENRIFVNKDGNRFIDEGERRDVMTKGLMEQEDSMMWIIVDKHSYPDEDTTNNFNETMTELLEQGRAFKGETIEELAKEIDVDPDNLRKSIDNFNKAVDDGKDEFGRTLFDQKLDKGPFYAAKRVPTVHHTMGGIEINEKAQVLNKNGDVIKGLFAAGEVTGGIHGTNRLGGNALADITVFGKIAGENAALSVK